VSSLKGEEKHMHNSNTIIRSGSAVRNVGRVLLITLIALVGIGNAFAQDNTDLRFKGAVGVIPVTGVSATGAVNLNIVRNVNPGAPWRIAALDAIVTPSGQIKVVGRGLLLASGNGIGTNAGQSVHATLFCGSGASTTAHDSPVSGVPLAADGDFAIDDVLSPALPPSCATPVLLIRNVTGLWFAAGIRKLDNGKN
jgi:hypothetical protein